MAKGRVDFGADSITVKDLGHVEIGYRPVRRGTEITVFTDHPNTLLSMIANAFAFGKNVDLVPDDSGELVFKSYPAKDIVVRSNMRKPLFSDVDIWNGDTVRVGHSDQSQKINPKFIFKKTIRSLTDFQTRKKKSE